MVPATFEGFDLRLWLLCGASQRCEAGGMARGLCGVLFSCYCGWTKSISICRGITIPRFLGGAGFRSSTCWVCDAVIVAVQETLVCYLKVIGSSLLRPGSSTHACQESATRV